jgi:protein gp37
MGVGKYANGFEPTLHEGALGEPLGWGRPRSIFVCSMADLFHDGVPFGFIDRVMATVRLTPRHRYQILTKRARRMALYFSGREVPGNVWLGVTVEAPSEAGRIDWLRQIPAGVRFLSCEPLVEDPGPLDLTGIDWVIVGGESGSRARPMRPEWVRGLLAQADGRGIAFFFKQWGAWGPDGVRRGKKRNGMALDGKIIQATPGPAARGLGGIGRQGLAAPKGLAHWDGQPGGDDG